MQQAPALPRPEPTGARIVAMADQLFYEHGFEATSFADIAKAVGLSRGNFYHHFKTKDRILDAVIARRIDGTRAMLRNWEEQESSPAGRLMTFARMLIGNRAKIVAHGCPVGTLCNELAKLDHRAMPDASAIFMLFREWLAVQFVALGNVEDADALAMHLLMRSQGVATLSTAFRDKDFIDREVDAIEQWIAGLTPNTENGEFACSSSS